MGGGAAAACCSVGRQRVWQMRGLRCSMIMHNGTPPGACGQGGKWPGGFLRASKVTVGAPKHICLHDSEREVPGCFKNCLIVVSCNERFDLGVVHDIVIPSRILPSPRAQEVSPISPWVVMVRSGCLPVRLWNGDVPHCRACGAANACNETVTRKHMHREIVAAGIQSLIEMSGRRSN